MSAARQITENLFEHQYTRLCRLIYRVVGDTATAEEIASDVFLKLHSKPPADTNLEAWLCRTGLNLAFDTLRRRRRWRIVQSLLPRSEPADEQDRREVRDILARLDPRQSSLLLLRAEGYTYNEIAAALDLSPSSVGTTLARAEAAFRKEYETRHG